MKEKKEWQFQYAVPDPPNGEAVELTAEDMERLLLQRLAQAKDNPKPAVWQLAQFYKNAGQLDRAISLFRDLLEHTADLETKAQIILSLGQTAELSNDYELAARLYREALGMEPCNSFTWYFIHNNLGYSLNTLGRYAEGEVYCRRAIACDAQPSNAHKNLGLSLVGQQRYREAAQAFIAATQANASDARSLRHLEALLGEHPELKGDFAGSLQACRAAVATAAQAVEQVKAHRRTAGR